MRERDGREFDTEERLEREDGFTCDFFAEFFEREDDFSDFFAALFERDELFPSFDAAWLLAREGDEYFDDLDFVARSARFAGEGVMRLGRDLVLRSTRLADCDGVTRGVVARLDVPASARLAGCAGVTRGTRRRFSSCRGRAGGFELRSRGAGAAVRGSARCPVAAGSRPGFERGCAAGCAGSARGVARFSEGCKRGCALRSCWPLRAAAD